MEKSPYLIKSGICKLLVLYTLGGDVFSLENVDVSVYHSGIVEFKDNEGNHCMYPFAQCELIWSYVDEPILTPDSNNVRIFKPKS